MHYWKMFFNRKPKYQYDLIKDDNKIAGILIGFGIVAWMFKIYGYTTWFFYSPFIVYLFFAFAIPLLIRFQPYGRLYWKWYWETMTRNVWISMVINTGRIEIINYDDSRMRYMYPEELIWIFLFVPGIAAVVVWNLIFDHLTKWNWQSDFYKWSEEVEAEGKKQRQEGEGKITGIMDH